MTGINIVVGFIVGVVQQDMAATEAAPDFAQQPMPYGVAIFAGGIYVAFTLLGLV